MSAVSKYHNSKFLRTKMMLKAIMVKDSGKRKKNKVFKESKFNIRAKTD